MDEKAAATKAFIGLGANLGDPEAQVRRSLSVGIDRAIIDAINARKTPSLADARERTCIAFSEELLTSKGLSDTTYAAAEKTMGLESLVALVASTGS